MSRTHNISNTFGCVKDALGTGGRINKTPRRKLEGRGPKQTPFSKLIIGSDASRLMMRSRACPGTSSPKRQTPMDIDNMTPPKRKRNAKKPVVPANQQLITKAWCIDKADRDGTNTD